MITVLLAVDVAFYREGLGELLARSAGIELVSALADAGDALRIACERRPDVVLIGLPTEVGLGLASRLAGIDPPPRVIPLAIEERKDEVLAWAEAGIAGYVTRNTSFEQLLAIMRGAAADEVTCSPRITSALLRRIGVLAAAHVSPAAGRLTPRELEVARLLGEGFSNKQIAAHLHVETNTVKNHVHNILDKLAVDRRGQVGERLRRAGAPANY